MGIDVGVAGYKGTGAIAGSVSYTTPGGVVLSTGVSYAGSGATVVRFGVGWRFKLGTPKPPVPPISAEAAAVAPLLAPAAVENLKTPKVP